MRIAVVSTPFVSVPPQHYGGTELVVHELTEGLVERGHDVTLFATGDSTTKAKLRALYPTGQWPPDPLTDFNHVSWAMEQVARTARYDVVHVHSAVALACDRFLNDTPLVYTLHHERDELLSAFYTHFPEAQYVAISEDQRRREVPLPHVDVIHHGLDPSRFEWTESPADYVCFVGRFSRIKGPHTAIDVAAHAGLAIFVAGEVHPPDARWAKRELARRLRRSHVRFLGAIGPAIKVPLLREARAFLAPIEWNEPFGLVFVEAMLSGCPVIAYGRGSIPEIVDEGITGFIVDSAEEMAAMIRPGGRLEAFDRRRCRERAVERFSRERMVTNHLELYERVAGTRSPGKLRLSEVV
jgi:glycosyltransferase involved in cell wall biosynthesis